MIGDCRVIAIEGAHGSGKSTLVHGVVGEMKSQGHACVSLLETARDNPFIEAVRIHKEGELDIYAELSLLGEKISQEARAARHNQVIVTDKTLSNILGYSRLILDASQGPTGDLIEAMLQLCRAYASSYDRVFVSQDLYDARRTADPYRPVLADFQAQADVAIRTALTESGLDLIGIPPGLSHRDRIDFVMANL